MDPRSLLSEAKRTWRPPAELQRSCPREVRLKGAGRVLLTIAVLCFLGAPLAGAIFHAKASADRVRRRELVAIGVEGLATVTRRWTQRGDHPRHFVEYLYEAEGRAFTGRLDLTPSSWSRLQQGSILPVRYLSLAPRQHLVPGYEGRLMPLWLPYFVAGALAAGGWLMTLPLKSQRRLLSEGKPTPGVVTALKKSQHYTVVRYSFATMSGAVAEGRTEAQKNPPPVGSLLCVLYEQDNARNNRAYPFSLYRCEI